MSINQNNSSKFRNIFVIKEQAHNFMVLIFAILLIFLSSFLLYECLIRFDIFINTFICVFLIIICYFFAFFKIFTSSLLIIKLNKIKNELKPERLNFYIYNSSWIRKKITTFWTTLSYLTIFLFIFIIYLIIILVNNNLIINKFLFIYFGCLIFGTIIVGIINYKIINSSLIKGKNYISAKLLNSYDNILEKKECNVCFKKIYIYLLFSLLIFPWFLMLSFNFRKKLNSYLNK